MASLRTLALSAALAAGSAMAQGGADVPRWRADATLSLSARSSATWEPGFSGTYGGLSPTYLALSGEYFFPGLGFPLSIVGDARGETFPIGGPGINPGTTVQQRAAAYFVSAGAGSAWSPLSWLRLEGDLGLGFSSLAPIVYSGSQTGGVATAQLRHLGPVIGASVAVTPKDPYFAELRVRTLPWSRGWIGTRSASAQQLFVGLGVGVAAYRLGEVRVIGLLQYELDAGWASMTFDSSVGRVQQYFHRFGVAVRFTSMEPPKPFLAPPSGPGSVRGRVLAADTGKPIVGAEVRVGTGAPLVTGSDGSFSARGVGPGPVEIQAQVAGYRAAAEKVTVPLGSEIQQSLTLSRKTGPGTLRGRILAAGKDGAAQGPIPGAEIRADGGASAVALPDGSFTLERVGPGPVNVVVNAKGYKAGEEAVSVPAEAEATLELLLAKASAQTLASLRGQVRSAHGGPVAATLKIPEAKIGTRADGDGRFVVRLPGGRYTVVFSAPGFITQSKVIEVADGDQALFYVDLSPVER